MTTQARTPRMPSATTAEVIIGIGWSIGIADQLSLPSIGGSAIRLGGFGGQSRARRRWDHLRRDGGAQLGISEPKGRPGGCERLPGEFRVAFLVQDQIAAGRVFYPIGKCKLRDDMDVEQHLGKTIAAEMRREALVSAFIVGAQLK